MDRFLEQQAAAVAGLVLGSVLSILVFRHHSRQGSSPIEWWLPLTAGIAFLLGSLFLPATAAAWLFGLSLATWTAALLVLLLSGSWSFRVGLVLAFLTLVGLGGALGPPLSRLMTQSVQSAIRIRFGAPWWLLLLVGCVPIVWLGWRSLAGMSRVRRSLAIGCRLVLLSLLVLALAEPRLPTGSDHLTVLFVVDRSLSIPPEVDPNDPLKTDQRWRRVQRFIADAVALRGRGHELDQAGVIAFGKRARLILPPSNVDRLVVTSELLDGLDPTFTDIAAAIKLALASFPESSGKRIVLLSDGNENLGHAVDQARIARANGVPIDVVTLAAGVRNTQEVFVESVEAPGRTEQGSRVPIRVVVRSLNPDVVRGELVVVRRSTALTETGETNVRQMAVPIVPGPQVEQEGPPAIVQLRPGVNSFSFRQPPLEETGSYTFEARFMPLGVINAQGRFSAGLPGDRAENNRAQTHVLAQGQRRILFIEAAGNVGQHRLLMSLLARAGRSRFQTFSVTTADLPANRAELAVLLSNFDGVVLANVPAEQLSAEQMEVIRSNTADQGCGLVMIGGPDSFGAGGWQGTPVEAALPVDCDVRNLRVAGKGGLVLIFHASEFDVNNRLQKETAKLAVRKLSPIDMLGVIYWDFGTDWYVRFQTVGDNKDEILRRIEKMTPNDMPDCNPALQMALEELVKPVHELATRHIIFISDGDHWTADPALLRRMKEAKVTCTTVCVTSHGANEIAKMKALADSTGARSYLVTDGRQLPAIYIQETRIVSQSFVDERRFVPSLRLPDGPAAGLTAPLPALYGFNRTSKKPSPLAVMPIEGPSIAEQEFPVLAHWQYGLGRAVAFTSDARTQLAGFQGWDRDWAASDIYLKFWEQLFSWVVRGVESGRLVAHVEYRDGKIFVSVDARDANGKPLTNLRLESAITPPNPVAAGGKNLRVPLQQKGPGRYEAEFAADDAGSYFLNITAKETATEVKDGKPQVIERIVDGVRAGLTIPYSPEFRDVEANPSLMRQLAEITGGNVYSEDETELRRVAESGLLYRPTPSVERPERPVWPWFVFYAAMTLLLDVGIRRIELDTHEWAANIARWWERRRHGSASGTAGSMLEQLRPRPDTTDNSVDQERAERRFTKEQDEQTEDGNGPAAPRG